MKKRVGFLLVLIGVMLAALSGLVVLEVARKAAETSSAEAAEAQAESLNKVYVVVAEKDLPENVALTAEDLVSKEFPTQFAPADAISAPELAVGKYTTTRLFKGQIVVAPLLSPTRMSGAIAALVPEGKIAMAVDVNDAMNSLGTLRPGDRVDILLTLDLSSGMSGGAQDGSDPAAGSSQMPASLLSTQVAIQSAEVLSVGAPSVPEPDAEGDEKATPPSKTLVFLLDHQDAVMFKFVKDSGGIMDLVVRSPGDNSLVKTDGVTFDTLFSQFRFRFPEAIR